MYLLRRSLFSFLYLCHLIEKADRSTSVFYSGITIGGRSIGKVETGVSGLSVGFG